MMLYLRLAWRNMWRHSRRTLIIVVAMGFTLAMMMMYDGLIAGFNDAIYGNAIKVLGGNIQVHAPGYHAQANRTPLLPPILSPRGRSRFCVLSRRARATAPSPDLPPIPVLCETIVGHRRCGPATTT